MRWEEALKINQKWTAEQARNDLERLIITGERPADKVVGMACQALDMQTPKKIELWNGQCACPNCNKLFGSYAQLKTLIHWEMPYCKFCGQALDWSDTE